jgi:hypothetical protein
MPPTSDSSASFEFPQYPKHRPPLPQEYVDIFDKEYVANRTSGGFANKIARSLESWMHRKVAATALQDGKDILELGAGSLNHLPWEQGYGAYDVVEPFRKLLDASDSLGLVRDAFGQLSEIPVERQYQRIISVAVLEHMLDLPMEIALAGQHLLVDGVFCAGVPSEGCWLWEMAWRYGTGPAFHRRTGLDYATVMHHEHVNTVGEIESCVRYFFEDVAIDRFPLKAKALSLYTFLWATRPRQQRCLAFLENRHNRSGATA